MNKPISIKQFLKKFPDDDTCLEHLMITCYGVIPFCKKCKDHTNHYRVRKRQSYECQYCGHQIYPKVGTPFEHTHVSLQLWFYAIYLFSTTKHGVSAKELERQLGVTYKTAWRMGHQIRSHMAQIDEMPLKLHRIVEADETYMGGKPRPPKGTRKRGKGTDKLPIFGMVERDGDLIAIIVDKTDSKTLEKHIKQHVAKGTTMSTDEYKAYNQLIKAGYKHIRVKHSVREYVKGKAHTNTLEGFWSHFKSGITGTHRSVSKKYMHAYLKEFEFRYNRRNHGPQAIFDDLFNSF